MEMQTIANKGDVAMAGKLRIDSLKLRNFRCFTNVNAPITFHPSLTVFVAKNGGGKSAILDAIRVSFGTFTRKTSSYSQSNFKHSDASIDPSNLLNEQGSLYPISVLVSGSVDGRDVSWIRSLGEGGRTTTKDAHVITDYGVRLSSGINDGSGLDAVLPILAYYGTNRLWEAADAKSDERPFAYQSRLEGYTDALTERSIFASVKSWLKYAYKVSDSKIESETDVGRRVTHQFAAVRNALNAVLNKEGWRNVHYNHSYEQMAVERPVDDNANSANRPVVVPITWTSDGVLAVFSLIADIAYRCARLNPQFGENACSMTEGIVLIDEVDLSLHPEWQQHILPDLRRVFPKIQFIVTTHSPQVVSSVPSECVRIISAGGAISCVNGTEGDNSSNILEDVFGTKPYPESNPLRQRLTAYLKAVYDGRWDEKDVEDEGAMLREKLGDLNDELVKAALFIENEKWEKENASD